MLEFFKLKICILLKKIYSNPPPISLTHLYPTCWRRRAAPHPLAHLSWTGVTSPPLSSFLFSPHPTKALLLSPYWPSLVIPTRPTLPPLHRPP